MKKAKGTRREFMGDGTKAAAGMALGLSAASQVVRAAEPTSFDTSTILNYNENMEYRRQGSTNLMISAVCLGGHWRSEGEDRVDVINRAIDVGINYIDCCTGGEVRRDTKALKGRRDKMYLGLSNIGQEPRDETCRTAEKMLAGLDSLLLESGQEYTDLWRITCLEPGGRHTFNTAYEIVEALETAKKQGKARNIGFSSHDRRWIKFMIEYFPEIDVVCFPFTTMSKKAPTDSLFDALKKCDVGAFGIKPYGAGSLFRGTPEEKDQRARLALRYILQTNTVIPIPGLSTSAHVRNAAKAVAERRELDTIEQAKLDDDSKQMWASLPHKYRWLKDWEYV